MLAVQRQAWEQGVSMQALYELGDVETAFAMAYEAVYKQQPDGRLAVNGENSIVTDPASCGIVVQQVYEETGNDIFRNAANQMLRYLLEKAPRTEDGIICHTEVSFQEGFSPKQIWADSIYMAPPFLAHMGYIEEAVKQIKGMVSYLQDVESGLLYHMYDAAKNCFVRKKLWATGNGWAVMGIAKVIELALLQEKQEMVSGLISEGKRIIDGMISFQQPDGRFHDILDDETSFTDGAAAMMLATAIYRSVTDGWLDDSYISYAECINATMEKVTLNAFGYLPDVCGSPDFISSGTSAEAQAAYLLMYACRQRYIEKKPSNMAK